jgi:hypothetical protein
MSSTKLIRWGGLAATLAGVSLIVQQLFQLVSPDPTTGGWLATHTLGYIGLAFGLLGQVSIFAFQSDKLSKGGTNGFILGFLGNALTVGAAFMNTFIVPVLTTSNPDLLAPTGPLFAGPLGMIILLASLLVTVGFIMFGIATARAGVLPATAAWLVVSTAWFGMAAIFSPVVFAVAGAVFGFANAWLGWAVWSSKG